MASHQNSSPTLNTLVMLYKLSLKCKILKTNSKSSNWHTLKWLTTLACEITSVIFYHFGAFNPNWNFFKLVIYSRFDCEVLSRLSLVFCLEMVLFIDIYWTSVVAYEIFSLSMADIYWATSAMWTTMSSDNTFYEQLYEFRLHCHLLGNLKH